MCSKVATSPDNGLFADTVRRVLMFVGMLVVLSLLSSLLFHATFFRVYLPLDVFVVDDYSNMQQFHPPYSLFTLKGLCLQHNIYATLRCIVSLQFTAFILDNFCACFAVYVIFVQAFRLNPQSCYHSS